MLAVLSRRDVVTAMLGSAAYIWLSPVTSDAEGMKPIQSPITGDEDLGDLSQPQQALAQFYRAFNTRDLKMIDENFAHSGEVAIDNPLGGIRRGADEPHKMYEGVFKKSSRCSRRVLGLHHSPSGGYLLGRRSGARHVP